MTRTMTFAAVTCALFLLGGAHGRAEDKTLAIVVKGLDNPFFDLKFAVTLALASAAIIVSLHLSRPEASLRGWG